MKLKKLKKVETFLFLSTNKILFEVCRRPLILPPKTRPSFVSSPPPLKPA